jgi:hypothetical protein
MLRCILLWVVEHERRGMRMSEVAPVHSRRSSMRSLTFAMHVRTLRRLSHGSLLFLAPGGHAKRTDFKGECDDLRAERRRGSAR